MSIKQATRMDNAPLSRIRLILTQVEELTKKGKRVLNLSIGQPDFNTPEYIKEAARKALDENKTKYPPVAGIEELKEAISSKYFAPRGLQYAPNEVLVTSGVAQAMYLAMTAFLNPGDEIVLPNPGYNSYSTLPNVVGAVMKFYDLKEENDFQVDAAQMAELITDKTKMVVIISPNNPIGSILHKESLETIADLVRGKDIIVLSDEIYEQLHYDGVRPGSIAALPGMREQTIVMNGFSKYYAMTGWRMGFCGAPAALLEPMIRLNFLVSSGANSIAQYACVEALNNGEDDTCEQMRKEFKRRRDYLYEALNQIEGISCLKPEGAFYIFLNIKSTGMSSEEFANYLLQNYLVATVPGTVFGANGEGFLRLSYAAKYEDLQEAVTAICQAVKDLSGRDV